MPPKAAAGAKAKGKTGKKKDKKVKITFLPRAIDPNHELYWNVCHAKSPSEIQPLIEGYKADVNKKNPTDRWTPLLRACQTGNAAVVRLLIAFGADPNYQDKPVVPGQEETVKTKGKGSGKGSAPLRGRIGTATRDTKAGSKAKGETQLNPKHLPPIPMAPVADGGSALHVAIRSGSIETLDVVLACPGLDPNLADRQGRTPLLLAAGEGRPMAASHIIQQAKPNLFAKDSHGRSCMHLAAGRGHREVCAVLLAADGGHRLLDERDDDKRSVLDHAMLYGNPRTVEFIKALRNDSSIRDEDWLRYAVRNGAVRLLPPQLALCFQAPSGSGDEVLIRLCHEIVVESDIALSGRKLDVTRKILGEIEPHILLWKNDTGQSVLHVACGATTPDTDDVLLRLQKLSSASEAAGDGDCGIARIERTANITKPPEFCFEEAEAAARLRLQRSLVRALLDRASLRPDIESALTIEPDGRGLKPIDYTCITGSDPVIWSMLGGKPSSVVIKLMGISDVDADQPLPSSSVGASSEMALHQTARSLLQQDDGGGSIGTPQREFSPEPDCSTSRSVSPIATMQSSIIPSPPPSARGAAPGPPPRPFSAQPDLSRPFSALSTRSSFGAHDIHNDRFTPSPDMCDQSTAPSTRPQTPSLAFSRKGRAV